jgi:hypothetical protein
MLRRITIAAWSPRGSPMSEGDAVGVGFDRAAGSRCGDLILDA